MADIVALQTAASRFPPSAGVTADGVMGPQTHAAVLGALGWIVQNVPDQADTAQGLIGDLTTQQAVVNAADGLTTYLNQVADAANLGGPDINVPGGSSGGGRLLPGLPKLPTSAANAFDAFKKLPTWLKVGLFLGVGGIVYFSWKHYHKSKGLFGY